MFYRIYNKYSNEYLPQDKWLIRGDGKIVDLLSSKGEVIHDPRDFIVEAWTGYFDDAGRKVYCGDILEQYSFYDFKSRVIWENGAFFMVPIDPEGLKNTMGKEGILKGWNVTGNVNGVEYSAEN